MSRKLMTNPLSDYMAAHIKKDEVYTVILNSKDSIREFFTPYGSVAQPPSVDSLYEYTDINGDAQQEDVDNTDPNYTPNNNDFTEITDTRKAIFNVDWQAILPHQYKKFHLETYFVSQLCVFAEENSPDINGFRRSDGNTSDGLPLSEGAGYFIKVCINGLNSSGVYDSHTQGRSSCVSLVRANVIPYGNTDARFYYETMSPHLCSPVVHYPSSQIITVELNDEALKPVYFESFLYRDYDTNLNQNLNGDKYYTEDMLPVMANWSIVLSFRPIE